MRLCRTKICFSAVLGHHLRDTVSTLFWAKDRGFLRLHCKDWYWWGMVEKNEMQRVLEADTKLVLGFFSPSCTSANPMICPFIVWGAFLIAERSEVSCSILPRQRESCGRRWSSSSWPHLINSNEVHMGEAFKPPSSPDGTVIAPGGYWGLYVCNCVGVSLGCSGNSGRTIMGISLKAQCVSFTVIHW